MKIWVKDHFGKPNCGYDRHEIVNGRRKKIKENIFIIPSASGEKQEVDLYAFLKIVEQAEQRYGELRNIKVCWYFQKGTTGFGSFHADYEEGCTRFWIEFERLETDAEEARREKEINKHEDRRILKEETKKLLKEQLAKYENKN